NAGALAIVILLRQGSESLRAWLDYSAAFSGFRQGKVSDGINYRVAVKSPCTKSLDHRRRLRNRTVAAFFAPKALNNLAQGLRASRHPGIQDFPNILHPERVVETVAFYLTLS